MSEDKSSKTNGLGTDPMQRLASFKTPRDLTLGGIKPSKKVFTPNLNVARNKSKGPTGKSQNDKKDKDRKDRKNDRNKNFKNGPNIIKSSGVFSEGLGSVERHSSRTSYGSNRESDTVRTMQKPTIRVKDFVKIDKELEEQKIKSVMGDSGAADDDSGEENDLKLTSERDAPIKLPMDVVGMSKLKPSMKVKQEVVIKREPDDVTCMDDVIHQPIPEVKDAVFEDTDVVNLLRSDQPTLILLQLPDTLPGRGGRGAEEPPRRTEAPQHSQHSAHSAHDDKDDDKPADNRCRMSDLEEGRIGRLRIHRSGRVTLALGDTMFEVSMGTAAAFHQEAVCVGADAASRSARLVSLGPLAHKLSLVPLWETLLKDL